MRFNPFVYVVRQSLRRIGTTTFCPHLVVFWILNCYQNVSYVYVSVLFPDLEAEVQLLRNLEVQAYIASRKHLSALERCLPKMGIGDIQIGFIFGLEKSAVSKIKQCWFPRRGYAGKLLCDLELYEDYVNLERPDAYYTDQLDDVGTQCDGKDFLTQSFCRSSAMKCAQRSSKMKAAAFRYITWPSLCGLV